jgi:hypothetical protein
MDSVCIAVQKLHDCQNEIIRLVEGIQDFILGDSDGRGTRNAALYFEKTQTSAVLLQALDVIAKLFEFPVGRFETKLALNSSWRGGRQAVPPSRPGPRGEALKPELRDRAVPCASAAVPAVHLPGGGLPES